MNRNINSRLQKLRPQFEEKKIDAIIISQPENRCYLSGFNGSAGYLVITAKKAILATDFRYIEQARRQAPEYEIFQTVGDMKDWFPGLVSDLNVKQPGFEAEHISFSLYRRLNDIMNKPKPELKLVPVDGLVESLRAIKEPGEVEFIARAAEISDYAFESIIDTIHVGMTEQEVAWEIEKNMREHGSQNIPFEIIVASGPNAALPHAKPSPRAIQPGEPIVIDIGARCEGYASDLSRTICLGTPDARFNKIYDIVLGAQLAAMALIKKDMSGGDVDMLARTVIEEAGYGKSFGHGLGHGVGLAPHELPRLGPGSADRITDGMVFTIEPGIYLNDWGGVRIEDLMVMENGKIRILSKARKD
jgi:Xaa-Pro aminopeptidase